MKRINLICLGSVLMTLIFFTSCESNKSVEKKELWAVVINFFSPDLSYYPQTKTFPFPDSLRFETLDRIFTNRDQRPVISDSTIVYYDNYISNGQKKCCVKDTLEIFTDTLNGKKYLFAIGEYVALFQKDSVPGGVLRARTISPADQLLDIKLNTAYPPAKFKEEHEKLGTKRVTLRESLNEVYRQKWAENDSILVETIQFDNSPDRIITAIYKDMNEEELNAAIDHIQNKLPGIRYRETVQPDSDGKLLKTIRMDLDGVLISLTQIDAKQYTFMITDYYETLRLIIKNAGTNYTFRDDIKIY